MLVLLKRSNNRYGLAVAWATLGEWRQTGLRALDYDEIWSRVNRIGLGKLSTIDILVRGGKWS